jgi:hypothetical protein
VGWKRSSGRRSATPGSTRSSIVPVAEVEEAHAILERRENIGKVVLQIAS